MSQIEIEIAVAFVFFGPLIWFVLHCEETQHYLLQDNTWKCCELLY